MLQHDIQEPLLTCRESIEFASSLSIDWSKISQQNIREKVKNLIIEQILTDLELTNCQHTIVGNEFKRGLSGGEKKRVSIAQELIKEYFNSNINIINANNIGNSNKQQLILNSPINYNYEQIENQDEKEKDNNGNGNDQVTNQTMICIMDECTTGLDSVNAYNLIKNIRKLMRKRQRLKLNSLVIMSLHAPSSEIVQLLDKVIVMSQGCIIYHGSPLRAVPRELELADHAVMSNGNGNMNSNGNRVQSRSNIDNDINLVDYLTKECEITIPKYTNIIEYLLTLNRDDPDYFIQKWQEYESTLAGKTNHNNVKNIWKSSSMHGTNININIKYNGTINTAANRKYTPDILTQLKQLLKREILVTYRNPQALMTRFGTVIFMGLLLSLIWHGLTNNCSQIEDRFGFVFLSIQALCMISLGMNSLTFPKARLILEKERSNNLYYTTIWALAKTIVVIPQLFVNSLSFVICTHWIVGLNATFLKQLEILFVCSLAGDSMGFLIGSIAKTTSVAFQLTPLAIVPFMLFANYLIQIKDITKYLRWIAYISIWFYGSNSMLIAELHGVEFKDCEVEANRGINLPGDFLLKELFNINYKNEFLYIMMCMVLFGAFRCIAMIILIAKNGL